MSDTSLKQSGKADSVQNQEKFLIESKSSVIAKLKQLAKNNCALTASFNNGAESVMTCIIEVLKDKDVLALDYGVSEALNLKLLNARRIFFKGDFDGITVQFDSDTITKAKLKNEVVFAIPIPHSILWMQRREFFRVRIPLGVPAYCEINSPADEEGFIRKYKLMDISAGGLSLVDESMDFEFETGMLLPDCELDLPEHGYGKVNLKVQNVFPVNRNAPSEGRRIGCEFINVGMTVSATIQRYINAIELARRNLEKD